MSVIHLKKKDVAKSKVRGVEIEFDHEKLTTILGIPRNNGICEYVKDVWEESSSGDNRRKDDDVDAPEGQAEKEDERNKDDFDWEAVIDEAAVEGESGSGERFYDAEDETQGSPEVQEEIPAAAPQSSAQQKEQGISEAELLKFQAEFEIKRVNRFHDDLEKAKAENARLLALLHQAQSKPHP
ncbi:hypothetical protein Dimus_025022 [Dionaea muscipula]